MDIYLLVCPPFPIISPISYLLTRTSSGTDFSTSKDQDWEEVRLKRQLADLEKKIEEAESAAKTRSSSSSKPALVKKELVQMLDYKRQQLRDLDDSEKSGGKSTGGQSLGSIRQDLDMVKQQVDALESHWRSREEVLARLRNDIDAESRGR